MLVQLYTRAGCHLCEVVHETLERVRGAQPFALEVIDVDADAVLRARFDQEVPVVFVDGRKHAKYRLDEARFRERLRRAARGEAGPDEDDGGGAGAGAGGDEPG